MTAHLAVRDMDTRLGDMFTHLIGDRVNVAHAVVNEIYLSAPVQLPDDRLARNVPVKFSPAAVGRDGRYRATLSGDWEIWGPMGGYVAAVALRAAAAEAPPGLEPASFTCQFLSSARFDAVDIDVTVRRSSRRAAAFAVRVAQDGTAILDAQVWFATPSDVVRHDHAKAHRHGHPDDHQPISAYTGRSRPPTSGPTGKTMPLPKAVSPSQVMRPQPSNTTPGPTA